MIKNFLHINGKMHQVLCQHRSLGMINGRVIGYQTIEPISYLRGILKEHLEKHLPEIPSQYIRSEKQLNDMGLLTDIVLSDLCCELNTDDRRIAYDAKHKCLSLQFNGLDMDYLFDFPNLEESMNELFNLVRHKAFELAKEANKDLSVNTFEQIQYEFDEEFEHVRSYHALVSLPEQPSEIARHATLYEFASLERFLDDVSFKSHEDAMSTLKIAIDKANKQSQIFKFAVNGEWIEISCYNDLMITQTENLPAKEKLQRAKDLLNNAISSELKI